MDHRQTGHELLQNAFGEKLGRSASGRRPVCGEFSFQGMAPLSRRFHAFVHVDDANSVTVQKPGSRFPNAVFVFCATWKSLPQGFSWCELGIHRGRIVACFGSASDIWAGLRSLPESVPQTAHPPTPLAGPSSLSPGEQTLELSWTHDKTSAENARLADT